MKAKTKLVGPVPYSLSVRFFSQFDVYDQPYPDALFRYREEGDLMYEEHWNSFTKTWDHTSHLTRLLTGGDCTVMEISQDFANQLKDSYL